MRSSFVLLLIAAAVLVPFFGSIVAILAYVPQISLAARVKMSPGLWFADLFGFTWGYMIGFYVTHCLMGARIYPYGRMNTRTMWKPKTKWGECLQVALLLIVSLVMGFVGANFMLGRFLPKSIT